MARKGKVNKEWRNARDAARSGEMPSNLSRSSGQMTPEALQAHLHRSRQAVRRAASTATNRERELTRRNKELA